MELMVFRELLLDKNTFKRKVRKVNFSTCTKIADAKALHLAKAWSFFQNRNLDFQIINDGEKKRNLQPGLTLLIVFLFESSNHFVV